MGVAGCLEGQSAGGLDRKSWLDAVIVSRDTQAVQNFSEISRAPLRTRGRCQSPCRRLDDDETAIARRGRVGVLGGREADELALADAADLTVQHAVAEVLLERPMGRVVLRDRVVRHDEVEEAVERHRTRRRLLLALDGDDAVGRVHRRREHGDDVPAALSHQLVVEPGLRPRALDERLEGGFPISCPYCHVGLLVRIACGDDNIILILKLLSNIKRINLNTEIISGDPYGSRTRVARMRTWCPNH